MKVSDLKIGTSYILKENPLVFYRPQVVRVEIVDKTLTTVQMKFEDGFLRRMETRLFDDEFIILEEIT